MQRESIVERDFMGLTNPNANTDSATQIQTQTQSDGLGNDRAEGLTKNVPIGYTVETEHSYSEANGTGHHFGLSLAAHAAGSVDGSSPLSQRIEGNGGFPSSNLSLSVSNFRENVGTPILLNGQQVTSTSGTSFMVKAFAGSHFAGRYAFCPVPSAIHAGPTTSRATPYVPGKPAGSQLTIFYAGTVNVYDDISPEKAQGLMLLAGSGMSAKTTNPPSRSSTIPTSAITGGYSMPTTSLFCSTLPSPVFATTPQVPLQKAQASIQPNQSAVVSPNTGDSTTSQSSAPPSIQQETSKRSAVGITPAPIVPRVPQARKASLARFLEKRKERIQTKAPYPTKKSPDSSPLREKSPSPKHCSAPTCPDGCPLKQHMRTGNGLDDKLLTRSEGMASCLDSYQEEQSWSLKPQKNEKEETETPVEVGNS